MTQQLSVSASKDPRAKIISANMLRTRTHCYLHVKNWFESGLSENT